MFTWGANDFFQLGRNTNESDEKEKSSVGSVHLESLTNGSQAQKVNFWNFLDFSKKLNFFLIFLLDFFAWFFFLFFLIFSYFFLFFLIFSYFFLIFPIFSLFFHIFLKIVAGDHHVFVLDTQKNLYCWGDNYIGQLGLGHNKIMNEIVVNKLLPSRKMIDIQSKGIYNVGLTEEGKLLLWPYQKNNGKFFYKPVELPMPSSVSVSHVSCGNNFVM